MSTGKMCSSDGGKAFNALLCGGGIQKDLFSNFIICIMFYNVVVEFKNTYSLTLLSVCQTTCTHHIFHFIFN
jgi:hypothetical protein